MRLDDLLAEYRESLDVEPLGALAPIGRKRRPSRFVGGWGWAAAGLVLAAGGFWLAAVGGRRVVPIATAVPPAALERGRPGAGEEQVRAPEARPLPVVATATRKPVAVRREGSIRLAARREREFVALNEAAMLPAPAVVQVVRVSVRPERLAQLGIPWSDGESPVDAEVLVGDDGIARALRVIGE